MSKQFLDSEGLALVAGHVNGKLDKVTAMPSNPKNRQTVLYVGETGAYTKGHIYQYQTNAWIDITSAGFNITNLAPAFDSTTTYDEGDIVTYEGQLYQCSESSGHTGAWDPADFSSVDVAELLGELNTKIDNLPQAIVPKGTVAFASLPSLANVSIGDMYNVSDAFTTTSDFITSGLAVKGNSCVYVANVGTDSAPVLKWNIFANIQLDIEVVAYDDFDPTTIASNKIYLVY